MSPVRLTAVLVLVLAVLAALTAMELYRGVDSVPVDIAASSGAPPSNVPATPTFTLPGIESLPETTSRPLFMPQRRVPEEITEPITEPVARTRLPEMKRLALSAVVIVADQRVALLNDLATGNLTRAREGDSVGGWQVVEIRDESVVIENGASREELPLRTFEAPTPMPAQARNPSVVPAQPSAAREGAEDPDTRRPRRPRRGPRQLDPPTKP